MSKTIKHDGVNYAISKKNVSASVSDFTRITPEKVQDQFVELIKIAQCCDVSSIAHANLDMRFKNPTISNHLKRIKESNEAIRRELNTNPKYGFKSGNSDYTEVAAAEIYSLISVAIRFGKDGIAALNEHLRLQLDQPERMAAVWQQANEMADSADYIGGKLIMLVNSVLFRAADNLKSGKTNQADTVDQTIVKNTRVNDLIQAFKKEIGIDG